MFLGTSKVAKLKCLLTLRVLKQGVTKGNLAIKALGLKAVTVNDQVWWIWWINANLPNFIYHKLIFYTNDDF